MDVAAVEIVSGGQGLVLISADGRQRELSAALLWSECPSAQGRVRRERGLHHAVPHGLVITAANVIGTYGVNIAFSDGHARGIYPWTYLATLSERPKLEDFLIN
jgi:prepilin-type processing-associated H-X9-DG protein